MKSTLVIGSLPRILVPVARDLHAQGIPVHGAAIGRGRKQRSKAIRSFTVLPDEEHDPGLFLESLQQLIAEHDVDTILPCGD